ncbi:hypothetical protein KQI88_15410 [Alkaliphilus sp. MSJ-5]|uniref:Uncharacterized protein n=1 Tax=Alkaliphilus flagellatus TaxID=2841507 RepID=A0ABS6G8R8_9FIRM|nr:hypothetical protein [Alkaliphilus flagellatus]MBU5677805.1 hypothetical protein [Alkaliphilus flagellatus]
MLDDIIESLIDLIADFIFIWSDSKKMKGGQKKIPLVILILIVVICVLILIKI